MKLRSLMQWIGLVALAALIIFSRHRIHQVIHLLGQVRWYVLILLVIAQLGSYWFNAKYYQSFFRIFGYKVPLKLLYIRALVINFVNQAFPSGGIAGTSYLSNSLKDVVPPGKSTLAQLMSYLFGVVSFLVVLTFGFLIIFLTGQLQQTSVRLIMLLVLVIVVFCIIIISIVSERTLVERLTRRIIGLVNQFARKVLHYRRALVSDTRLESFISEFYHGYETFSEQRGHWRWPFWHSLGYNLTEVATVYVVFLAFGHLVNPGAVIAAYTLANLASLLAVFTTGAGVYEATMIGTLVALGVPFSVSLPVVLVYRVLNFVIFLPIGYYFYRKTV